MALRRRAGHDRTGFTLVEALVVIVVVAIVARISFARIDFLRVRVNSEARSMSTSLTYAQRLAISLQHDVIVTVDTARGTMAVHEDANNNFTRDANERVRTLPLDVGVSFSRGAAPALAAIGAGPVSFTRRQAGLPVLIFHRDGTANEAGGFYINSSRAVALGQTKYSRAIAVTRATGRVGRWTYSNGTWAEEN